MMVDKQHKAGTLSTSSVIKSQPSPVNFTSTSVNSRLSRCGLICSTNDMLKRSSFLVLSFMPASVEPIKSIDRQ